MRTISAIAKIFNVDKLTVKLWCKEFEEYLSSGAVSKRDLRTFSDDDFLVLSVIYNHWEDEPDYDHIKNCLNSGDQYNEIYLNFLYSETPIFRDPPEELSEDGFGNDYAVMLSHSSEFRRDPIQIARAYKKAGDLLVDFALSHEHPHDLDYPIFFNYRHSLELYLKILTDFNFEKDRGHNLNNLVNALESKYQAKLPDWFQARLDELSRIDPGSFRFRYPDNNKFDVTTKEDYIWINLYHLRAVMQMMFSGFDQLLNNHSPMRRFRQN